MTKDANTNARKRPGHSNGGAARTALGFRVKLLVLVTGAMVGVVALLAWGVTRYTQQAFAQAARERSDALVSQFRSEYAQRGAEVVEGVESIAESEGSVRMALDLTRPQADPSLYANDASGLAAARHLDFLDVASDDGTIVSSAQWPGRVGYRNDWVTLEKDWNGQGPFLARVDSPDNVQLGLLAVRVVHVAEKKLYVIGGRQLDRNFLRTAALPAGMRALLYRNLEAVFVPGALSDSEGPVADFDRFASLIQSVQNQPHLSQNAIDGTVDQGSAETFATLPLTGRHDELLAVLLVGSSPAKLAALGNDIRSMALLIAAAGMLFGLLLSWWVSARVTRPLERVTSGVRAVAAGNWESRVAVTSRDEFGALARDFNEMTVRLTRERERLVQDERVTAWREMARRLASEMKEPLFPLQITIETLAQAREKTPSQIDETLVESVGALRAEFEALREVATRFGDFAKMPAPRVQPVSLNEALRAAVKASEPRFGGIGRPPITPELFLDDGVARINADPGWLEKALENLLQVSLDAMPAGGALTIRTLQKNDSVRLELSNTSASLKAESATRMFTPYDISKQGQAPAMTGLGLATVLAIVNDHGGRVRVDAAPGAGTTFRVEFPAALPAAVEASFPAALQAALPPLPALPAASPAVLAAASVVAPVPLPSTGPTTGPTTPSVEPAAAGGTRRAGAPSLFDFALNVSSEAADQSLSAALAESDAGAWEPKRELPEIPESQPAEQSVREG
jgi:two-component system, NtrC family, nitrogen regulation sensor histidine kinase NtrY